MRRVVSYSILIMLCTATIGTGVVVATVFGSIGLPEADSVPIVTAIPTSVTQVLPTTTSVASPTPAVSPAQPTRPLVLPTMSIIPTPTDEASPTISAPTPSPLTITDEEDIEYVVQSGDLLYTIALEYDVAVEDILAINIIENPDSLTVGSVIRIPR